MKTFALSGDIGSNGEMRFLGIDYGSKRIGIAYSDEAGSIAMPFGVMPSDPKAVEKVISITKEKHIDTVVLGESKDLSGKDNKIMKDIEVFKKNLEAKGLIVVYEREFFTSMHAQKGDLLDASAAALILQRYLDRLNHSKTAEKK